MNRKRVLGSLAIAASIFAITFIAIPIQVTFTILGWIGLPNTLEPISNFSDDIKWTFEYFVTKPIDDFTVAIGEPRYYQKNITYLIKGENQSLLFDSGTGHNLFPKLIGEQTNLPLRMIPSHLHYDHLGGADAYPLLLPDLPHLREKTHNGIVSLTDNQHLGYLDGTKKPELKISEWIKPDSFIDLGNRKLQVLHTPGHTEESTMLFDPESKLLFGGDFIYPDSILLFIPGTHAGKYLSSLERLLSLPKDIKIYPAHAAQSLWTFPVLSYADLAAMYQTLVKLKSGELDSANFFPLVYPINKRLQLVTFFPWSLEW